MKFMKNIGTSTWNFLMAIAEFRAKYSKHYGRY